MVSLVKSNGEKPDWILSDYWRVMSEYWRTSKAKDKSEKARASRLTRRDGLGYTDTEQAHVLMPKFRMFW